VWIIFSLRRRMKRKEQALTKQLLTPVERARGLRIKIDLRGLMRGDSKTRAEFYQIALQNGWMTINEVRELEACPQCRAAMSSACRCRMCRSPT
jgi:phage portal protein BeeE